MGTRSLLGYELPSGKIYAQYLQFDGGPEYQGQNYFLGVLRGLMNLPHLQMMFWEVKKLESGRKLESEIRKPSPAMFKRIRHFLNEAQYQSGHSVKNSLICTRKEWFSQKIDCNQEWQYLFTRTGDFIYFSPDVNLTVSTVQIVIPWGFIKQLLEHGHDLLGSSDFHKEGLQDSPWWAATKFNGYEENKKVVKWGQDVALHINDELDYDSSKLLKEKLIKGESVTLPEPILKIEYGKVNAFPQQGDNGFRSYSIMTVGTTLNPKIVKTMFADYEGERKELGTLEAQYLRGKKRIKE